VEVADNFPEECRYVLERRYATFIITINWRENKPCRRNSDCAFHQDHSEPFMKGLHDWMEAQLREHKTEPNSGLGKAISYLLNHWMKLTLFSAATRRAD